jgi:hypothetical protein
MPRRPPPPLPFVPHQRMAILSRCVDALNRAGASADRCVAFASVDHAGGRRARLVRFFTFDVLWMRHEIFLDA